MASFVTANKNQNVIDLALFNGSTIGACATVDYDIYRLPDGFRFGGWQACAIACGSASLQSCTFKLLGGIDGTNFMSFSSMTVSDTAFSGSLNMKLFSGELPFKFVKLSLSTVSYGAGTGQTSVTPIRVLLFGKV